MRRHIGGRIGAAVAGAGAALLPLVAFAKGEEAALGSRALPAPGDLKTIVVVSALAVAGVLLTAAIGYLYRRERHLDWAFQQPDAPAGDHH